MKTNLNNCIKKNEKQDVFCSQDGMGDKEISSSGFSLIVKEKTLFHDADGASRRSKPSCSWS